MAMNGPDWSSVVKIRLFANSLLAASLLLAGSASTLRATSGSLAHAPVDSLAWAPLAPESATRAELIPEVRGPIRADTSTVSLAELESRGLFRPDATQSPTAFEQIRRQLARAVYSPQQLEELKQTAPALYETLYSAGEIQSTASPLVLPSPGIVFRGQTNQDQLTVGEPLFTPPDTNGDVGPNHYVQTVNTTYGVFNKSTGVRTLGPLKTSSLFTGFGGPCETTNNGDPIVIYDQLADRWLISQFALPNINSNQGPFYQCIAISTSGNPAGTFHRYQFLFDNTLLNDYPHFGLWPDGYYATVNMFAAPDFGFAGMGAIAYQRDKMLTGDPSALQVIFKLNGQPNPINQIGGGLPSDLDGTTLPPPGSPNIIAAPEAAEWTNYPTDRIHFFKFHVDWTTPANSTFTGPVDVDTGAWNSLCDTTRACVPQKDTSARLDAIADRFMWRLAYRNFGAYQTLVANQTVNDGSGRAGVRWYEIREPHAATPSIYQQSTYAPADGVSRWMGSAAQDKLGNLMIGFSGSSSAQFPDIRYAGRLQGDPLNNLTQGETIMLAGGGSQTSTGSRWGDYSNLTLDPTDDCTFWYTNEVYTTTSSDRWSTAVGSFKFPACGVTLTSHLSGSVRSLATGLPITHALVMATNGTTFTLSTLTDASGAFGIGVPGGKYTVTASAYGYLSSTLPSFVVANGVTATLAFTLATAPTYVISGLVTSSGSGAPLSATVTASGSPSFVAINRTTNPATGFYSMTLVGGGQTWSVAAAAPGHIAATQNLGPIAANQTVNFQLQVYTTLSCGGAFAASSPTFNRPLVGNPPAGLSGSGTAVYHRPITFSVGTSGVYSMVMSSGLDGYYVLYQSSFNPASPLANVLQAVDDVNGLNPAIFRSLSAGTQYILVATTFSNGTTGPFTDTLTGFGAINAGCFMRRAWLPAILR